MSRTFNDSLAEEFENAFADPNEFGVWVILSRGAVSTDQFKSIYTNREHEIKGRKGSDAVSTSIRTRDFLLPAAALILNGEVVAPQKGDRIEEVESGEVHEIMPVADMPAVDLQAGNYNWLAHTKRVTGPT